MAMAPAIAQTVVYQDKTTSLSVTGVPGYSYEWELYADANVNFALVPGNCPVTSAKFVNGNRGAQVSVQWLKPGIYFFKVTAHDPTNCAMNLKIGMIKVIPPEVEAIITGESIIGACQKVKLDASKSIGKIAKYEWSLLDIGGLLTNSEGITTEFSLSSSYRGPLPSNFRVTLKVTDIQGYSNKDTLSLRVDPLPVAAILTTDKTEKDGSMTINGSTSVGTGISYRWYSNEGKILGNNQQPVVLVNGPGLYFLEVTDSHGCISKKSVVFPSPNVLIANKDYARTSWEKDITIRVLSNDYDSNNNINPSSVKIITNPSNGTAIPNADGTVTYHPTVSQPGNDEFTYEVCDSIGLCDSAPVVVDIYDAGLTVPEAFSPNGDGLNETLKFIGLENYPKSQVYVYTRGGQLVYQSTDYHNDWDGKMIENQKPLPLGTYYYVLKLGGTNRVIKGFVFIKY